MLFDATQNAADYAAAFQALKATPATCAITADTPITVGRPNSCASDPSARDRQLVHGASIVKPESLLLDLRVRDAAGLVAVLDLAAKHYNDAYGEVESISHLGKSTISSSVGLGDEQTTPRTVAGTSGKP